MSCESTTYYQYSFEGPPEDEQLVRNAIEEWNSCGVIIADLSGSPGIEIVYDPDLPVSGEAYPYKILYTHVTHTQALIAHEMGHTLGLHEHFGSGLMNESMLAFHVGPEECEALRHRE